MPITDDDIGTVRRSPLEGATEAPWTWHGSVELFDEGEANLRRCVGDVDAFFNEHWERSPLLARGKGDFDDLLDLDAVDRVVARGALHYPAVQLLREGHDLLRDESLRQSAAAGPNLFRNRLTPERVLDAVSAGATLILNRSQHCWPGLDSFCRALTVRLSHQVTANVFLTPAGSRGNARHWDPVDVLVLQLHGTKTWTIEAPIVELPMWTPPYKKAADLPPTEVVLEADLTPGDCLYLPRGFTHSARAQVDPSLHISLVINDGSIVRALSGELGSSGEAVPGLDVHLPVGFERNDVPSPSATAWQVVDGLRFDGQAVLENAKERFWVEQQRPVRGTLTSLVNSSAATVDTEVERTPGIVVRTQLCDGRMFLRTDAREVSLPATFAPLVAQLIAGPPVVLADIVAPAGWDDGLVVVRRLLREGILVWRGRKVRDVDHR
jgi:lysine-specific demethylase/histidyl-hydroxylase NO66